MVFKINNVHISLRFLAAEATESENENEHENEKSLTTHVAVVTDETVETREIRETPRSVSK